MRIVRVATDLAALWAVIEDGVAFRLPAGPFSAQPVQGGSLGPLESLQLEAPAQPSKIVCVGRNYVAHAAERGEKVPTEPLLFLKPPSSILAPGATIVLPRLSDHVDHEAELALIIGRRCRNVSEAEAWSHVLGVTCGNDVTARDLQRSDHQFTRGKGFDTFCPLGPWITCGLSEAEVRSLGVRCTVDGDLRQDGRTDQMVFSPSFLISYITQVMTLEPGDVIMTGTPAGVGPLSPGNEVTVEIDGLGELSNPVREE